MAINEFKPAIFGLTNYVKTATITASEEAASHDADELKTASYSGTYRSTGVTADRNLDFDLGAVKSDIGVIALFGVNFTDDAEWQIFVDNNAGFPSPEHDSLQVDVFDVSRAPYIDDTPARGRPAIYLPSTDWTGRYVRAQLTDTANPDGFLEAAYAVIGPLEQPEIFTRGDWTPGEEWVGPPGRTVSVTTHRMTIRNCDEGVRREVLSIARALQGTGRFGFIPRPGDTSLWLHEAILCRLSAPVEQLHLPTDGWDLTLHLREVID